MKDDYFTCNYDNKRGCFVIIDDTGNGYALNDADCVVKLVNLLNKQDERIRSLESLYTELMKEGDFDVLLNLMNDYNLTWNGVCNIITEAIND